MCKHLVHAQVLGKKILWGIAFWAEHLPSLEFVHLKSQQWQAFFFENLSLSKEIKDFHCGKEVSCCFPLKMHFMTSAASMRNSYKNAGNWVSGKYEPEHEL